MSFDKSSSSSLSIRPDQSDKICLVQLSFEQDSVEGTLFCKKVRICGFPFGIDSVSTGYIKEINFPIITNQSSRTRPAPTNLASLATRKCGGSANFQRQAIQFANLTYPRIDLDLARSLERFTTVVVNDQNSSDFLSHYVTPNAVIINIENSLAAMMVNSENDHTYTRSQQTQTDTDDLHTVRIQIDEGCEKRDSVSTSPSQYEPDNCNNQSRLVGHQYQHHHRHHQQQQPPDYPTACSGADVCGTARSGHHTATNNNNNTRKSFISTAASTYLN